MMDNLTLLKHLEAMLQQSRHEQERIVYVIEGVLDQLYREQDDYKRLVKLYGRNAPQLAAAGIRHVLTHDQVYNLNLLREDCKRMHFHTERLTSVGIEGNTPEQSGELFDALMHDANLLAYRHALMCNIRPEDDIKVDSMLRALAKDHTIPEEIIDKFKMAEGHDTQK